MQNTAMSAYAYMRAYRPQTATTALVQGVRRLSYGGLYARIGSLAARFQKAGIKPKDIVAVALPNIFQNVVAFYALSHIGAIALMIHPKAGKEQFDEEIKKTNPKMVLLSDVNAVDFAPYAHGAQVVYCPYGVYAFVGLPRTNKPCQPYVGNGEEIAVLMHSGGTSGVPKTVALSNRALNAMVRNLFSSLDDKFDQSDSMLTAIPLFHGFGLGVGVHCALSTRMKVVLLPKFDKDVATRLIAREHITILIAIPRMLEKLLKCDNFCGRRIKTLKEVYVGGDTPEVELQTRFDRRLEQSGASARVSAGYGLTETCSVCTLNRKLVKPNTIGLPLDGVKTKIVDEGSKEVKCGEIGELLVGGEQVMSAYFGDDAASDDAFEMLDGEKWLKTGDMVKADKDGYITFVSRKKRLVKISGMNVFLSEIERVAKECGIEECVALQTEKSGKKYIALVSVGKISDEQKRNVQKKTEEQLSHWSVPRIFSSVDALPRTALGKIDYMRLYNEYQENRK